VGIFAVDENGQAMAYDSTTRQLHDLDTAESVVCAVGKYFRISNIRNEVVRWITVTYSSSAAALTMNIYANGEAAASQTVVLPIQATMAAYRVKASIRAQSLVIEIIEGGTGEVEIGRITIEHD